MTNTAMCTSSMFVCLVFHLLQVFICNSPMRFSTIATEVQVHVLKMPAWILAGLHIYPSSLCLFSKASSAANYGVVFAWVLPFWGACDPFGMSDRCSVLPSPTISAWSCHGAFSGKCCFALWGSFVPPKTWRAFRSGSPIPFTQIPSSTRSSNLRTINYTIAQQLGWERIGETFSVWETEIQVPLLTCHWQKQGDTGRDRQSAAATGVQWPTAWQWMALRGCWEDPREVCGAGMGPSPKGWILSCGKLRLWQLSAEYWTQPSISMERQQDETQAVQGQWVMGEEGCNSSQLLSICLVWWNTAE